MSHHIKVNHSSLCIPVILCRCAVMLLLLTASAQAQSLADTAELVPPETIVLVDIHNFSQLKQQSEKTSLYKLYQDPAMAAFLEHFKTKLQERTDKTDNELLRTILNLDALPEGRVALALVLDERTKDAGEPPLVLISQWGSNTAKVKEAVEKLVNTAVEEGMHRRSEQYRGVDITTITLDPSKLVSFCFVEDYLIGSIDLELLKFTIAHLKGATSPTLAGDAGYISTMKAVGPYHDVDLYVNIKQIIRITVGEEQAGEAKQLITNLGFDNITGLGCSVGISRLDGAEGASCAKALLKVDGAKKGICRMLEFESSPLRLPRFVPASAYSVSLINLDIKKVFDELYGIAYRFSPQMAALMQMPLVPPSPDGEPGVALKTGIIDHMGSHIVSTSEISKPASGSDKLPQAGSLIALAVENRNAIEKSFSRLHSTIIAPDKPDARRELLGHTMYLIDIAGFLPGLAPGQTKPMQASASPAATPTPKFAITITDTHLIFGTESAVEQVIRSLGSTETESINSKAWFRKAKSGIPSVTGLAGLQDNSVSGEFFWTMLRNQKPTGEKGNNQLKVGIGVGSSSPLPQVMLSQVGSDMLNFSLLPEFDVVRKYFGLTACYGVSRDDGFFFEFKYLNRPESE